jgi:hypothetical protein
MWLRAASGRTMIEWLGKYVGGKVITAGLVVVSALVVIWYWRLPPEARAQMWGLVRGALIWLAFVAVLPWALFFLPAWVVRREQNWASAALLLAYLAVDAALALFLTGWRIGSTWQTAALLVGFALAGIYNFAVCEYLAQRSEESL